MHMLEYFFGKIIADFYFKIKGIKIIETKGLSAYRKFGRACFVYANHTQPVADALMPVMLGGIKRKYTVLASKANFELPILGRIIPRLGAIMVPKSYYSELKSFVELIKRRVNDKNTVVIYPEAHVIKGFEGIRRFPVTSFDFPVMCDAPVFSVTTTYCHEIFKTRILVYMDGPFYPDKTVKNKENATYLHDVTYRTMLSRSAAADTFF